MVRMDINPFYPFFPSVLAPLDIGQHVLRVFASSNNADEPHPPAVVSWTVTIEKPWDQTAVTFKSKWAVVCTDTLLNRCMYPLPWHTVLISTLPFFIVLHVLTSTILALNILPLNRHVRGVAPFKSICDRSFERHGRCRCVASVLHRRQPTMD